MTNRQSFPMFCKATGLRINESLALRPEDISEDGTRIFAKRDRYTLDISVSSNYTKEVKNMRNTAIKQQQSKLFMD